MTFSNFHSHTTFCDGKLSPEEMVRAAIAKGCPAFGFSGHSRLKGESDWCLTTATEREYIAEVTRLKAKYSGQLEVFLGIEQDYCSPAPQHEYDYIIGSVHCLQFDGKLHCVDLDAPHFESLAETHFGGDYYALAEAYYALMADIAPKTGADIIGHFDLVTKFNAGSRFFDESHPRYVTAATDALVAILEKCRLFEVNTGAMYRLGNTAPYPSAFLLRELLARGGEVILSSDSHDAESLCYKFDEAAELLRSIGFRSVKTLTNTGFTDISL